MRWIRSLAVLSWILVAVLAAAGFAAFSPQTGDADSPVPAESEFAAADELAATPGAAEQDQVAAADARQAAPAAEPAAADEGAAPAAEQLALPAVSGRTAAFVLAEAMEFKGELAPPPDPPALLDVLGPDGSTTSTTTSSTTTTTEPPPATVAEAEPTTTTTHVHETTTTTHVHETTTTTHVHETTTTTEAPPETTPTTEAPAPAPPGDGVERWRPLVELYFRAEFVEEALWVMDCESGGNPDAQNSRTGAAGLFQFMPRTWATASAGAGFGGASPFDGEANIAAASWLVEDSIRVGHSRGRWGHWSCRP